MTNAATLTTITITTLTGEKPNRVEDTRIYNLTAAECRYVVAVGGLVCASFKAARNAAKIHRIAAGDDALIALATLKLVEVRGTYVSLTWMGKRVAKSIEMRAEREARAAAWQATQAQQAAEAEARSAEREAALAVRGVRRAS